jgi:CRISPR-associated protein Csm1
MPHTILKASSLVAFAALLHDLGKFAERAKPDVPSERLDAHIKCLSENNSIISP